MSEDEFIQAYLPKQMSVDVAFSAMAHFLASQFNSGAGSAEVRKFVQSISADEFGRPTSDEVFKRFKEAAIDADRLEQVARLKGVQ